MSQAVEAYRHITVTPEFREAERLRSKARHDEAQALFNNTREIVVKALQKNMQVEDISDITGLTYTEIESIRNSI